jgi:hypothetical protein
MTAVVIQQAAPTQVVVSQAAAPVAVTIGIQGPPGADGTSSITIDPQAGNLLTTSPAGLFVNGALDLGTFN